MLVGAALGAVLVNYAHTTLSEHYPSGWLYLQGALFIVVVAFAPKGLASLGDIIARLRRRPVAAEVDTVPRLEAA